MNHPFTILLGGHPQAISLAAPLLEYKSLKELFLAFCTSNMMDALSNSSDSQNKTTSLRVSLELSISHMKNSMAGALKLFGFIGLLPGGISQKELTMMWGDDGWVGLKDALIRASLLVYKTDPTGEFIYSMLPFMTIRACELLVEEEKRYFEYHIKCCKLYKNYLYMFYLSDKTIDKIEKLVAMETNIWACIYRSNSNIKVEPLSSNMSSDSSFDEKQSKAQWDLQAEVKVKQKKSEEQEDVSRGMRLISSKPKISKSMLFNLINR